VLFGTCISAQGSSANTNFDSEAVIFSELVKKFVQVIHLAFVHSSLVCKHVLPDKQQYLSEIGRAIAVSTNFLASSLATEGCTLLSCFVALPLADTLQTHSASHVPASKVPFQGQALIGILVGEPSQGAS
jgi:hypothetical protein